LSQKALEAVAHMLNEPLLFDASTWEIVLRLGAAAMLGMALGWDRERHGTAAGLRTHGIICLSGAVVTVTALILWKQLGGAEARVDPLRVVEGMATAVGIVGAGLVIVRGGDVKNLTSAAHIWLTVTIGIACGAGYWPVVVIGAGLALIMLIALRSLAHALGPGDDSASD
jgi:putative Mg2+ transporter-C (MgtC) family protein